MGYLQQHFDELDADSQRRLESNPLRILDSKHAATREILQSAPLIIDYLDETARTHFATVCEMLESAGIEFTVDPGLVRGLDYYTSTVFEWKTTRLGAQNTVCAGGRYDDLVERRGGRAMPACGFAMGMERLVELLAEEGSSPSIDYLDAYLISLDSKSSLSAMGIAENLRNAGLTIATNHGVGKLKSQLKKADLSGARLALILGQAELESKEIQLIPLRGQSERQNVAFDQLQEIISNHNT